MGKLLAQSQNYLIEICEFDEGYLNAVPHIDNLEYEWYVNHTYYTSPNNQHLVWWDEFELGNSYMVNLRVRNECGWSNWNTGISDLVTYPEYVCESGGYYVAFSNPSTNELNVTIKKPDEKNQYNEIKLFDMVGEVVYEHSSNLLENTIDVTKFKNGKYLLQIKNGKNIESTHIEIK